MKSKHLHVTKKILMRYRISVSPAIRRRGNPTHFDISKNLLFVVVETPVLTSTYTVNQDEILDE